MCLPGQPPPAPASAADAAAMAAAGLGWLAGADAASWTTAEQADCLRALERVLSLHTAAQARVLTAFYAQDGCADDGHGSARTWLKWQTRVTSGAAAGAIGWMRRLRAHPAIAEALASAGISASWARQICEWTDRHAPRGALLYPRCIREELGGRFLGLMAYLEPKGEGDSSMPGNQWSCPGVWGEALGDPHDMAKAGLPESQSPEDAWSRPPERRL